MGSGLQPGEYERNVREQQTADRWGNALMAVLWIFAIAFGLTLLYGVVRFVKWAWST
jgi:hypothetical protein